MVKAYLRYQLAETWGVVHSNSNLEHTPDGQYLVTASLENVSLWNLKEGTLAASLVPPPSGSGAFAGEVTRLAVSGDSALLAAGHRDGSVRLWQLATRSCLATFAGHRGPVSALRFSADSTLLASGGKDTDVVLWDVASESGLCRLRGHLGEVTDIALLERGGAAGSRASLAGAGSAERGGAEAPEADAGGVAGAPSAVLPPLLVLSSSKDGTLKVWDPEARHCRQTVGLPRGEAWAVDVSADGSRVALGAGDEELRWFAVLGSQGAPVDGQGSEGTKRARLDGGDDGDSAATTGSDPAPASAPGGAPAAGLPDVLISLGSARRRAAERAVTVRFGAVGGSAVGSEELLLVQGAGKVTEVFRVRGAAEAQRHARRRKRRREGKEARRTGGGGEGEGAAEGAEGGEDDGPAAAGPSAPLTAGDELEAFATVRSKHRARASGWIFAKGKRAAGPAAAAGGRAEGASVGSASGPAGALGPTGLGSGRPVATLALATASNSVEAWDVGGEGAGGEAQARAGGAASAAASRRSTLEAPGNRADVRAVAWTPDDRSVVSAGAAGAAVWNPRTGARLRAIECEYVTSVVAAPGSRHAILGAKSGALLVADLGTGEVIESLRDAHGGSVWSLALLPDGSGFVSGSADKDVKLWDWAVREIGAGEPEREEGGEGEGAAPPRPRTTTLSATLSRTLKMSDEVLGVRATKDGRLLAVALLDASVRVFFADTLKFSVALYGHSLPVLALDASDDGTLLATGGADRNVRIWGLDYGDCRRSLHAHSDAVMAVSFVPGTHHLFTAGKDGSVRYWDADKFTLLLELPGHSGAVWALAPSAHGDAVVTGGADRSLRRWDRTDEPFFADEEAEKRLESLFEGDASGAAASERRTLADPAAAAAAAQAELPDAGNLTAGRATLEGADAADSVAAALDLAAEEEGRVAEASRAGAPPPEASPLLLGRSPSEHVRSVLRRVPGADLEAALLALPYADALSLLERLGRWLDDSPADLERLARTASLLLRLHAPRLAAAPAARSSIVALAAPLKRRVRDARDVIGVNLAALDALSLRAQRARAGGADLLEEAKAVREAREGAAALARSA